MMNKLYYGCYFWCVTILFSSNKLLKLKYIHNYFLFFLIYNENITMRLMGRYVLWAGASYGQGNTVYGLPKPRS
jgi:hypothetical protein